MLLKEKRTALLATLGVLIVITIPAVYLSLLSISPLTFDEMDFDDNGYVKFSELIYANSSCVRRTLDGQVVCE